MRELGSMLIFGGTIVRRALSREPSQGSRSSLILQQVPEVYWRCLATVCFAGAFVGAILTLQFNLVLAHYDGQSLLGGLTTSACIREVAPLIISFLLAGKIGAYTAAELGTMRVTDQMDAIECLGMDPMDFLVVPRWAAITVAAVLLLVVGLFVALLGSLAAAWIGGGINPMQFIASIPRFAGPETLAAALIRSLVYGWIVATVSCHQGYTAAGGAQGVGRAVTRSAIFTNLYLVLATFGLAQVERLLER